MLLNRACSGYVLVQFLQLPRSQYVERDTENSYLRSLTSSSMDNLAGAILAMGATELLFCDQSLPGLQAYSEPLSIHSST